MRKPEYARGGAVCGSSTPYGIGDCIGGRYQVEGIYGGQEGHGGVRSGMGIVYLVFDHNEVGGVHAFKTFQDRFLASKKVREAFRQEALTWVRLGRHPHILQARRVEEVSGRLYIVMRYIWPDEHGRNCLSHYLNGDHLPLDETVRWAIQFCYGLEHAYLKGIVCHRDIKPDNIMMTSDGILKITDFGLAGAIESGRGPGEEELRGEIERHGLSILKVGKGIVCGTPGYMAPEVLTGHGADVRSDIWSFGVVLHQMAVGSRISYAYEQGCDVPYIRPPRVEGPLWPAIERCLAEDPARRFRDFAELRNELEALHRREIGDVPGPLTLGTQPLASEWSDKGASLCALGRYEDAIVCYDRALEADPSDAGAWSNKGIALSELSKHDEALSCYDRALGIDPTEARIWLNKGASLNYLGQHGKAIECLDGALGIDARLASAWNGKGDTLCDLGRPEDGIVCYDRAIEIDALDAYPWYKKGFVLQILGRSEQALACYDQAISIDPQYAGAWSNKGVALSELGRHEAAISCHDRALEIDDTMAEIWSNKAATLIRIGRPEEAVKCCERSLKIDSGYRDALFNKGLALGSLGRPEEAIACYDRAVENDPGYAKAWRNKGVELTALDRHEEAVACYDRALQVDPLDAEVWSYKGCALASLGQPEQVVACSLRALEIDPRLPLAWFFKALAEEVMGHDDDAARSYRQFLTLDLRKCTAHADYARERLQELESR